MAASRHCLAKAHLSRRLTPLEAGDRQGWVLLLRLLDNATPVAAVLIALEAQQGNSGRHRQLDERLVGIPRTIVQVLKVAAPRRQRAAGAEPVSIVLGIAKKGLMHVTDPFCFNGTGERTAPEPRLAADRVLTHVKENLDAM